MEDEIKSEGTLLDVPLVPQTTSRSRSPSPTGSVVTVRNMSPTGGSRSQTQGGQLSTELTLKVRSQMSRLSLMKDVRDTIKKKTSLEEVLEFKQHVEDLFKAFLKQHEYFETVWPSSCMDHPYFQDDVFLDAQRTYAVLKTEIAKVRSSFPAQTGSSAVSSDPVTNTKLPDISLPEFQGDYSEWPTFNDLFKSLILDNSRLSDVERLHYLRGCLKGESAQLIQGLPLTGQSLRVSLDLLAARYENKRLIVQAYLDRIFSISAAQKNSSSLNKLITTVTEAKKTLNNMGVEASLGEHVLVYHVSKQLDPSTREAWELSLGSSQEYPSYDKMHTFVTARVRALERVESAKQSATSSTSKGAPQTAKETKASSTSRTAAFASSSTTHPCDQCGGTHYIVACEKFRGLTPVARRAVAEKKRLCFNCLVRHNAKVCRSAQKCKTCAQKHHTMLHDDQRNSSTTGAAQSIASSSPQ